MNTALIIALIPYTLPELIVILVYTYHLVAVHIPGQQRAYLEQWAKMAAAYVEQKAAGKSDEEKKALAMSKIKSFFNAFKLPCPPDDVLSAAIEAAVKFLPKSTLQGGSKPV
jgi:hypothetical protein